MLALLIGAPVSAQEDLLKKEQNLYDQFCAHCHGKHMVNPGTSSFDLRTFPKDQKDRFYDSVKNGRGDMPAWGDVLYPEELDLLWHYVKSRGVARNRRPLNPLKHLLRRKKTHKTLC